MPNAFGKKIDKTFLSVDMAEKRGFIHRDYIAHCLRWSHVVKYLQQQSRYKTASILDIGCGKEIPLLKLLYSSKMLPAVYTGVDYGPVFMLDSLKKHEGDRIHIFSNTSILDINCNDHIRYSTITMFEALEHMEKDMGIQVLEHIKSFMDEDTIFFMSTPCYDGVNKAGNHVYEWGYQELYNELKAIGYTIANVWGTFASMKDYKYAMEPDELKLFNRLSEYYDVNLVSCIFAPLFPDKSRNCIWQLTK
jgi:2-polyprenyl-3-methyl-5-hydroxy-6-metoxy-1,4-benzoquinol methylase